MMLKINKKQGFSLIEVLVSLSIFTMVVVAAVAVLLTLVDANKKSQNISSVMSNLSFALDSMTREIRMGTNYFCQNNNAGQPASAVSVTLPTSGSATNNCDTTQTWRQSFAFREGGVSLTGGCPSERWIGYRYNPGDKSIERRICDGDGSGGDNQSADWERITGTDVEIESLQFTVTGAGTANSAPPSVTIHVDGHVPGANKLDTSFSLQTTVTQQLLDI